MTWLASLLCHTIVVPSQATRRVLLEAKVQPSKLRVIPEGVPVPARAPTRAQARAGFGLSPDAFVVSTLARLVPEKGIADLIEAVARLPASSREVRVLIAGDGPERAALQERAAARLGDRAVFLGRVEDTADVYAAADVFVLPSYLEGFGLVYVEAAMHGVPSIGADVGSVPEVVEHGETGLIVPPGQPDSLAAAILRLREDGALCAQLGANAKVRAHAEFTEQLVADRYMSVFRA